jgi:hypothetical protein
MTIVAGVDGVTPSWLSPDMRNATTQAAYARLMTALALRFQDQQVLWELANEPNLNSDWSGNATAFGVFMHTVCGAMHEAAPRSLCVGPSNAFISRGFMTWNWLQTFFETGVLRELDALLVHPYRCNSPETSLKDFGMLRTLVAEYSPVNRSIPIYSGEWGYADGTGATPLVTVDMQAKLVSRLSLVSMMATDGVSIYYVREPRTPLVHECVVTMNLPVYLSGGEHACFELGGWSIAFRRSGKTTVCLNIWVLRSKTAR